MTKFERPIVPDIDSWFSASLAPEPATEITPERDITTDPEAFSPEQSEILAQQGIVFDAKTGCWVQLDSPDMSEPTEAEISAPVPEPLPAIEVIPPQISAPPSPTIRVSTTHELQFNDMNEAMIRQISELFATSTLARPLIDNTPPRAAENPMPVITPLEPLPMENNRENTKPKESSSPITVVDGRVILPADMYAEDTLTESAEQLVDAADSVNDTIPPQETDHVQPTSATERRRRTSPHMGKLICTTGVIMGCVVGPGVVFDHMATDAYMQKTGVTSVDQARGEMLDEAKATIIIGLGALGTLKFLKAVL